MRKVTILRQRQPVWSEGEHGWIQPARSPHREGRPFPTALRREVMVRNAWRAGNLPHETTRGALPAIIYTPLEGQHGNFIAASYRRILANPQWSDRLTKVHTARRQARPSGPDEERRVWRELDTASSSDALLMNIFCYPRVLRRPRLLRLLGIEDNLSPSFGVSGRSNLKRSLKDKTELDMRLGTLLVEAKLTEADFQYAPVRLMERYRDFEQVFDRDRLEVTARGVRSYQLLRGVLAAHHAGGSFAVMADARRPDLREAWMAVLGAVPGCELRMRLRFYTWQEIAGTLPQTLQEFLAVKYGIVACE